MCGIVGVWERASAQPISKEKIQLATNCLRHRGPDDAGVFIDGSLALGHRRLSIIDTSSAGHQPMSTPDSRFTLVFNGEIYNYRQLQEKYLAGIKLQSTSDTEVLLLLLARHGVTILSELRGMFAVALWDGQEQALTLLRDPFGKKPLYYSATETAFLFASEAKAIWEYLRKEVVLDRRVAVKYFLYEYVPAPGTIDANIKQVPSGHWLRVTKDSVTLQSWWQPAFHPKVQLSEAPVLKKFDQLLGQAVERRLVADVPVGVFLSGGLDSTTIAWYMKRVGAPTIHSFSTSFTEASFDESQFARLAAEAVGTTHHDIPFTVKDVKPALAESIKLLDLPLADASLLPMYLLSKTARKYITVALDGDGSDELLGGYGTFVAAQVAEKLRWLPPPLACAAACLANQLPTSYRNFSFDFKVKLFLKGLGYPLAKRNQIWLGSFSEAELTQLLTPAWQIAVNDIWQELNELEPAITSLSTTDAVSYLTMMHYLHDDILVKLDRATMMTSLEARTPFLDIDLAEFLMKLPSRWKKDKYLLKRLMRGRIPQAIIRRPKKGFGIPLGFWLRGPLHDWAATVLAPDTLIADGVIQPTMVQRLLTEHRAGKADHRKKLWTLLLWQLWYDQWVAMRPLKLPEVTH